MPKMLEVVFFSPLNTLVCGCVFLHLVISRLQSRGSEDSPSEGAGCEVGPRTAEALHDGPWQVVQ